MLAGLRIPLAALVCFIALAAALEDFWRQRGYQPSIVDGMDRWAAQRARVYGDRKLALVGDSRIMFNVAPDVLRRELPGYEVLQLGIGASFGGAVLRDLANDEGFSGTVIASMRAEAFERSQWDSQQDFVDFYREQWSRDRALSRWLKTQLASRFVLMSPSVGIQRLLRAWAEDDLPPPWIVFHADRSISADYTGREADPAFTRDLVRSHYGKSDVSTPRRWLAATREVESWIDRIQARGGRVALVRFPTSGPYWRQDERVYPRVRYWDRYAGTTSAVTVHFKDVPAMRGLELPDSSHVNHWDAPVFTESLLAELTARGLFDTEARADDRGGQST